MDKTKELVKKYGAQSFVVDGKLTTYFLDAEGNLVHD
jgi:hypothetical protein